MGVKIRFGHLNDMEFAEAFEAGKIAGSDFHHGDHLRLAWIYVREFGESGAEARLLAEIGKMAERAGKPEKFHYTMTVAWLRMVVAAGGAVGTTVSFDEWAGANTFLGDKNALLGYYSKERLESAEARDGWVDPDLRPLPGE